jgi:ribosomal protein S18 acetylase RimI-like enzyme
LISPIRLYTFQQNQVAARFYERQGFKVIQYSDGSENEENALTFWMSGVPDGVNHKGRRRASELSLPGLLHYRQWLIVLKFTD